MYLFSEQNLSDHNSVWWCGALTYLHTNDIFNQNKSFARSTGSGWTQNSTNSVIGRYYMVQFTYNLRRFGKKGSKNIKDYDGVAQPSGSRRMGPGGPGGPPPGMFHGPR